jgi:hypothetical protein
MKGTTQFRLAASYDLFSDPDKIPATHLRAWCQREIGQLNRKSLLAHAALAEERFAGQDLGRAPGRGSRSASVRDLAALSELRIGWQTYGAPSLDRLTPICDI